ncbi:hypothetical protein HID58_007390 [Brassica napus]|uniref:Uncharacterized protein n=1 Tax=Brassica napus TaxID=3708 RepID=A0ABQ7ZGN4_BRANA|nr:hypothetical protein HID58_066627 [Brassica napus]KAH0939927.1 hypothetical protein HID58_007388 [Brassica napus]KAH0939929.1 hypothetical protein HID58_007390 [Brassica napus]
MGKMKSLVCDHCRVWNYAFVYYYFIAGDWIVESYNQSALNICLAEFCFPIFRVSRDCNLPHLMRSCNDVFTKPRQGGISPYELHYLVCKQVMIHCPTHFYSFIIASSSQMPLILGRLLSPN